MTPTEFRTTLDRYYLVHFPDTRKWARDLSEDTKQAWAAIFANVQISDLRAAIELVVSGQEEIPAHSRERTASILRVLAGRIAYRREQREEARRAMAAGRHERTKIVDQAGGGFAVVLERAGNGCLDWFREHQRRCDERFRSEDVDLSDFKRRMEIAKEVSQTIARDMHK